MDFGDIEFDECEMEEMFGMSGNMPNPRCKEKLKKAKKRIAANKKLNRKDMITGANTKWPTTVPYSIKNITDTAGMFSMILRMIQAVNYLSKADIVLICDVL